MTDKKPAQNFILGRKLGMSQVFDDNGNVVAVTLIEAGPCFVLQIKKKDCDGYDAVQLGFLTKKKNILKPRLGHIKKYLKESSDFRYIREFRINKSLDLKEGEKITLEQCLKVGDKVKTTSITKAKGFQGVVKRHSFRGSPATHGTKDVERAPGSIGSRFPQRTLRGMRMAGRMGNETQTAKNLKVIKIDEQNHLLALKGCVAGAPNSLVKIIKISK